MYPIPEILYQIIKKYHGRSIDFIKSEYNNEYDDVIDDYFKALEEKELIFFPSDMNLFPPLSMEWDEPYLITNAIFDLDNNLSYYEKFIQELKMIGCHSLQIRAFSPVSLESIEGILSKIGKGRISTIELLLQYLDSFTVNELRKLCEKYHRLALVTIHSSPVQAIHHFRPNQFGNIFYIKDEIKSERCCGIISLSSFTINIKTFTESHHHNSCLNRKISIDAEGNIKNCPSMAENYGNIRDTTLREALEKPGFKKYWDITKDQIAVCKDCEFRYICTDCRAYLENPKDMYS